MKPLPFPFPLNIGTDIVHLPRIAALLTRRGHYLDRFTRRILHDEEQRDFHSRFKESFANKLHTAASPRSPPITAEMTRWLAGRFAAKEAARKAAPGGAASIGWKDVVVRIQEEADESARTDIPRSHTKDGVSRRPEIVYLGNEADGSASRIGRLSISHDGEYVVATVLAAG